MKYRGYKSLMSVLLCFVVYAGQGQNAKIDSLKSVLQAGRADTQRVNVLYELGKAYYRISPDTVRKLGVQALQLAKRLNFQSGIAKSENNIGVSYYFQGDYPKAFEHYEQAMNAYVAAKNQRGISSIYNNLGIIFRRQGNYAKALDYYQKALTIQEKIKDEKLVSYSYNNLGLISSKQGNYKQALAYYEKSLLLKKKLKNARGIASSYNNIGVVYEARKDYLQALKYFKMTMKIYEVHNSRITPYYSNIGNAFMHLNQLDSALIYHKKGLDLAVKTKSSHNKIFSLIGLAKVYYEQKRYDEAIAKSKEALQLAQKKQELELVKNVGEVLYKSYQKLENYKEAFKYQALYVQIKDSLFNDQKTKELTRLELNYAFDKKQALVEIQNEKKLQKERFFLLGTLGVLLIVMVAGVFMFRSRQVQKRLNGLLTEQKDVLQEQKGELQNQKNELSLLNEELQQNQDEIIAQRDYIETQNQSLSHQQERIQSSMRVAQTIQQALLPFEQDMQAIFTDFFLIYRPKDIVSGDFYWLKKLPEQTIMVVADCTGHGVPGAFMSLIGINLLDKIIFQEGITDPPAILDCLHMEMNKALNQQDTQQRSGGMDGIVLSLAKQEANETKLVFASAKTPLYYMVSGETKLQVVKGDRKSIGGMHQEEDRFTRREIILPKNSLLYTGSDGLEDQNNLQRKKIGRRRLAGLLSDIASLDLQEQKKQLEASLEQHMEGTNQRDDMLWLSIRI